MVERIAVWKAIEKKKEGGRVLPKSVSLRSSNRSTGQDITLQPNSCFWITVTLFLHDEYRITTSLASWTTLTSSRRAERKDTWKVVLERRRENGRNCFSVLLLLSRVDNIVVLLLKTNVRSHKVVHSRTFPFPRRNYNSRYFSYLSNNFLRSVSIVSATD